MRLLIIFTASLLAAVLVAARSNPHARATTGKPVFAHYMIGEITNEHTRQDIVDAQALGIDAFALNIDNIVESWATNTVNRLFANADSLGFKLFFSFDMADGAGYFTSPSQFQEYLKPFLSRSSYFRYNDLPVVSTFGGEKVSNAEWESLKSYTGNVLVIPGFYQYQTSGAPLAPENVFKTLPALEGVFNWNSWPQSSEGHVVVPTITDKAYLSAANAANKLFILGISPIQFKHMDAFNNWYRRGEDNLEYRLEQALEMQPHMLELQTWNDAGESHYMGNLWPEPMTNAHSIKAYVTGYDHTGYGEILAPFIRAFKAGETSALTNVVPTNGKAVQGAFWHHTLTVDADCSADPVAGKSNDVTANAEDVVTGVLTVAKGKAGLVAVVNNGGRELGKFTLREGYNRIKAEGLGAGKVQIEVWDGSTMISGGYGPIEVATSGPVCNYNFQVVGMGV